MHRFRFVSFFFVPFSALAVACSSGSTAGTSSSSGTSATSIPTSSASPPAPPASDNACRESSSSSGGPRNNCNESTSWQCGNDEWLVTCTCGTGGATLPGTCKCEKNGNYLKSVPYAGCSDPTYACPTDIIPTTACGIPL
jgi:hypothetical protein